MLSQTEHRSGDRAHVDASAIIVTCVLDRDDRLLHILRHLIARDVRTILIAVEAIEFHARVIENDRALRRREELRIADIRKREPEIAEVEDEEDAEFNRPVSQESVRSASMHP